MRANEVARMLVGGAVVYVAMAACAGGSSVQDAPGRTDGSGGAAMDADGAIASGSGGSARDAGGSSGTGGGFFDALTDPVPEARADNPSGSRLKGRYVVGADGSKQFVGWRDTERSEDCTFSHASDGTMRCLPAIAAYTGSLFADTGCSQPVAAVGKNACSGKTTPAYAGVLDPTACPPVYRLHSVAGVFNGDMVFSGTPGLCNGQKTTAVTTSLDLYAVGAEVPPTSFVLGTESVE